MFVATEILMFSLGLLAVVDVICICEEKYSDVHFPATKRVCFNASSFSQITNIGPQMCVRECSNNVQCWSVDYVKDALSCAMFSIDYSNVSDFQMNSDCTHYSVEPKVIEYVNGSNQSTCPPYSSWVKLKTGEAVCAPTECPEDPYPALYVPEVVNHRQTTIGSSRIVKCKAPNIPNVSNIERRITCTPSQDWQFSENDTCPYYAEIDFEDTDQIHFNFSGQNINTSALFSWWEIKGDDCAFVGSRCLVYVYQGGETVTLTLYTTEYFNNTAVKCMDLYLTWRTNCMSTIILAYAYEDAFGGYLLHEIPVDVAYQTLETTRGWRQHRKPIDASKPFKVKLRLKINHTTPSSCRATVMFDLFRFYGTSC